MSRILALVIKEFLALLRDSRSRFVIIGPPLIQLVVFGYAATYDLSNVPFAVFDESGSESARELVGKLRGSPNFREVATLHSDAEIAPLLDDRSALIVFRIGRRFGNDIRSPDGGRVQVILDGRDSNTALIALGYVRTIVEDFNRAHADRQGFPGPPAHLDVRSWFNPNLLSRWFIVPGIVGLLTLVVTLLVTALSVAREREQGTFDQLLVTPYRQWEILVGKAVPGIIIGLAEASLIIVASVLWFEVPLLGSLPTLYLGTFLFLLSAARVGLTISSLSVTQQQGLLAAFLFLVPAIVLSGFATPIANMPPLVQKITLLNPMRYFLVILRGIFLEGTPFSMLTDQLWPLALIGVATLTTATFFFRRRVT